MKFGAHMPTAGGAWRALERGVDVGCEIIQIFVKNNMLWFGRAPSPDELGRFQAGRAAAGFATVFGHTGYLINLAGPDSPNRDKSIASLIQEIEFATTLELPFLVLHPGAHLGQGEEAGLAQAAKGLDAVFKATANSPVRIALENTAGQGTCLGHVMSHLGTLFKQVARPERLGVCLDTAHAFAAGHDLRTPRGWKALLKDLDDAVGLDQVLALHLNDSKTELGSRVDRHAGIGQGRIGRDAFAHIVNEPRFRDLPGCLETPKSPDLHEDRENLATLRGLVRGRRSKS